MRFACLALVLFACKRAEPPPAIAPPPAAGDAAVVGIDATIDASGAAQIVDVELVQLTAARVHVSSQVANPNIRPTHLVDKNMSTAWNSVTGELVGAWIEIRPIAGAEIHEVRLTAGFTAKGPKGEDWFTMNPRIRRMHVHADGGPQPDIYLDVDKRELQTFPIIANQYVRLEVGEIVPGTRKQWREISVSELEAWGSTPAGWVSPRPLPSIGVEVGDPTAAAGFDPCAGIDEARAKHEEKYRNWECDGLGCDDHDYAPTCNLHSATIVGAPLESPWDASVVWCASQDEIYGPSSCSVRFARGTDETIATYESPHGVADMSITIEMREVLADSAGREVVVTMVGDNEHIGTALCRSDFFTCSDMIEIGLNPRLEGQPWKFK